jgi:hypothetical protein
MHRIVAVPLVVTLVLTTGCSPLMYPSRPYYPRGFAAPPHGISASAPVGRWDEVMLLPAGSTIVVVANDGVHSGRFGSADAAQLTLSRTGGPMVVPRAQVMRVDVVDLHGSEGAAVAREAGKGALVGAGAAAVVGAMFGGQLWPPPPELLRAGIVGGAASGGYAGYLARQRRIVYLAPSELQQYPRGGHQRDH